MGNYSFTHLFPPFFFSFSLFIFILISSKDIKRFFIFWNTNKVISNDITANIYSGAVAWPVAGIGLLYLIFFAKYLLPGSNSPNALVKTSISAAPESEDFDDNILISENDGVDDQSFVINENENGSEYLDSQMNESSEMTFETRILEPKPATASFVRIQLSKMEKKRIPKLVFLLQIPDSIIGKTLEEAGLSGTAVLGKLIKEFKTVFSSCFPLISSYFFIYKLRSSILFSYWPNTFLNWWTNFFIYCLLRDVKYPRDHN